MRNKKLVFSIIVMFIVLVGILCVAYTHRMNRLSDFSVYRPMVFVLDILYGDSGTTVDVLPDDVIYIGKIKEIVSQKEAMLLENFNANTPIMGNEIYSSDDSSDKIYIKILNDKKEKYVVYIYIE